MVERAHLELDPVFRWMYSPIGRPLIPPEQLLRALVLQLLYTVRSERLLMEQLDHDLLFRWFVGSTTSGRTAVQSISTNAFDPGPDPITITARAGGSTGK